MTDQSRSPGGDDKERIRQAGQEALSGATEDVRARLERGKSTAADSAASTSEVLEHTASDLSSHGQESLARATSALAGRLSDLATQLEQRSLDELTRDASELARRNPGLFVAGGLAVGVALSRFFKATPPSAESSTTGVQRSGGPAYGGEGALPSEASRPSPGGVSSTTPSGSMASPASAPTNPGNRGGGYE